VWVLEEVYHVLSSSIHFTSYAVEGSTSVANRHLRVRLYRENNEGAEKETTTPTSGGGTPGATASSHDASNALFSPSSHVSSSRAESDWGYDYDTDGQESNHADSARGKVFDYNISN